MVLRVVIVGGGFSGAAAAVQLVRRSAQPVQVTIVEPREEPGRGLAYSTTDPDHRLNAPVDRHTLDPDDPQGFERWIASQSLLERDPEARWPDGRCFPRRQDFGRFVADTLRAHSCLPNGSTIVHRRELARSIEPEGRGWRVQLARGPALSADLVMVATGNPPPRLPGFVGAEAAARRGVIGDPMDTARLREEIGADERVLVLGSGLTALDVISTLLRGGHRGPVTVVSRRGLRPHAQPAAHELPLLQVAHGPFDAPGGPLPGFIAELGPQPRLRTLLRALRHQVRADALAGRPWFAAFGALRDSVWRFWPGVPEADKHRFVRHLKVWYDVHRFLSPPQNEAMVQAATQAGTVRSCAARVQAVEVDGRSGALAVRLQPRGQACGQAEPGLGQPSAERIEHFDALVNCTGIDGSGAAPPNDFLRALRDDGWLRPGPAGLGFAVDPALCAIGRDGAVRDTLRVIGPPSLGACGDPIGAGYIAMHLRRMMPDVIATLQRRAAETASAASAAGSDAASPARPTDTGPARGTSAGATSLVASRASTASSSFSAAAPATAGSAPAADPRRRPA